MYMSHLQVNVQLTAPSLDIPNSLNMVAMTPPYQLQPMGIIPSTSQKHRNFVMEPMGEKPVTELAGIGKVLGGRLIEAGLYDASQVMGHYLVLRKDEDAFKNWIKLTCGANSKQQNDCFQCLNGWCHQFH